MKRAAFLDRDGVINQNAPEGEYVLRWEDLKFLPGADEAIRLLNRSEFLVIVVSNQRCVGKGLIAAEEIERLHARMRQQFAEAGSSIDAVYYCPHDEEPACTCRKPKPGMLFHAARSFDINLRESWMIGDSEKDVAAGKRAGCRTVRIKGTGTSTSTEADLIAASLLEATQAILQLSTAARAGYFEVS